MIAWSALLLPALLSAVLVFIASSLVHMVVKWHNSDYRKLSNEDEVRAAIHKGRATPGQYVLPHCLHGEDMRDPAMLQRWQDGPVGMLVLKANGAPKLGGYLWRWFVYTFVIALLAGYVAQVACAPGSPYLDVFRIVGTSAWLAYAWQSPSATIWKGQPWSVTLKDMTDGLVYALLTAGAFAWLWPR
jgi:hypothetical protein